MKGIGYFTAPVMCYFLVEGFYKTSSRRAYAKRLFVFALVSQVPYFLAFNREAAVLNMMFSLLFSFLILCVFHGEAFRRGKGQLQIAGLFFLSVFSDWSALAPAFTLLFDRAGQERKKLQKTFLFVTAVSESTKQRLWRRQRAFWGFRKAQCAFCSQCQVRRWRDCAFYMDTMGSGRKKDGRF